MTQSRMLCVQHRTWRVWSGEEYEVGREDSRKGHWDSTAKGVCAMLRSLDVILWVEGNGQGTKLQETPAKPQHTWRLERMECGGGSLAGGGGPRQGPGKDTVGRGS